MPDEERVPGGGANQSRSGNTERLSRRDKRLRGAARRPGVLEPRVGRRGRYSSPGAEVCRRRGTRDRAVGVGPPRRGEGVPEDARHDADARAVDHTAESGKPTVVTARP